MMQPVGLAMLTMFFCATAVAAPFEGSTLLVGHGMKQPSGEKTVEIGLNLEVAPLNAVLASQRDNVMKATVDKVCAKSKDPACRQSAQAYVNQAMDTLAKLPDAQFKAIQSSSDNSAALDQALLNAGVQDPAARTAVTKLANSLPAGEREDTLGLAREIANSKSTNLLFEPYALLNLEPVAVALSIPFTLAVYNTRNTVSLGNINLDVKMGDVWDLDGLFLGLSGGLGLYLPTGTRDVSASALANFLLAPKYTPEYLSFAPYGVVGFDFDVLQWQSSLEFMSQHGVRLDPTVKSIQYLKYGTGLVVLPTFLLSIIAEINGLQPIHNADIYKAVFFAGGLQFKLGGFKASVAVQVPVYRKYTTLGTIAGVNYGELSGYTLLGRFALVF